MMQSSVDPMLLTPELLALAQASITANISLWIYGFAQVLCLSRACLGAISRRLHAQVDLSNLKLKFVGSLVIHIRIELS